MAVVTGKRPLILIRGFGFNDVSDEQESAYQGFNDGTVYPEKRGLNYIYEGFVLRAIKSTRYPYIDATNVVQYGRTIGADGTSSTDVADEIVESHDAAVQVLGNRIEDTLWVYRFYDLSTRTIDNYGRGLVHLLGIIRSIAERSTGSSSSDGFGGVDIVAHSMGGLIVNDALDKLRLNGGTASSWVHRVVTLGTPHRGIAFEYLPESVARWLPFTDAAANEIASFDPTSTQFLKHLQGTGAISARDILCVVGTDYRTYRIRSAVAGNRLSSLWQRGTLAYNQSDGLVKQSAAQLPGAPRTFVHKCHGGVDSLVRSREAWEISTRFFHGTHYATLRLATAEISAGADFLGKSEYFFGVSIKPLNYDFELFDQSADAENLYGPFSSNTLDDDSLSDVKEQLSGSQASEGPTGGWAGENRLIWEGWFDARTPPGSDPNELAFRLDIYVAERDAFGVGFSDNVVFHEHRFVKYRVAATDQDTASIEVDIREKFRSNEPPAHLVIDPAPGRSEYDIPVGGTGFSSTLRLRIEPVASG